MQSDIEKIDVFERNPGFNNYEMWKKCELLRSVVFQMIETKVGRGKSVRVVKSFKHKTPAEIRQRIINSCEHYKKLYEEDMNTIQFRDYQTRIIHEGTKIIKEHGFLYLAMEVRTGKTLTSLGIA